MGLDHEPKVIKARKPHYAEYEQAIKLQRESDLLDVEPLSLPGVMSPPKYATPQGTPTLPASTPAPVNTTSKPLRFNAPKLSPEAMRPAALTVSAVLSRTGHLHPIQSRRRRGSSKDSQFLSCVSSAQGTPDLPPQDESEDMDAELFAAFREFWDEPEDGPPPPPKVGRHHTGSALEAIGALFLRQDSAGSLDQLSLRRNWNGKASASWFKDVPLWLRLGDVGAVYLFWQRCKKRIQAWWDLRMHNVRSAWPGRSRVTDDTPSTPLAMPGSYLDNDDDDDFLLPPPLLDKFSDPRSFEGLLGVRRLHEQQLRKQYLDKQRERNLPAHRVDIFTAFANFVRSVKASEAERAQIRRHPRFANGGSRESTEALFLAPWLRRRRPKAKAPLTGQSPALRRASVTSSGLDPLSNSPSGSPITLPESGATATIEALDLAGVAMELPQPNVLSPKATTTSPHVLSPLAIHTPNSASTSTETSQRTRLTPRAMLQQVKDTVQMTGQHGGSEASSSGSLPYSTTLSAPPPGEAVLSNLWVCVSCLMVGVTCIPGFVVFLLAHLLDLLLDAWDVLSDTLWFLRWIWQNATGQTILGRIGYEAFWMFSNEWEHVVREDHEARGDRVVRVLGLPLMWRPRGLSTFQVLRGLVELACLQAVTRERYVREGAGLKRLADWQDSLPPTPCADADDEELVVTSRTVDILELSRTLSTLDDAEAKSLWLEDHGALVRNIKWASQLAMSAYGLRVLIMDLPPVFTPSGRQLPRQTFAHLTRLDADDVLHADIQNLDVEAAYSPTFYVVRDMRRKVVCVAVRGTQSFADIVVDLDMRTEDVTTSLAEWRGVKCDPQGVERFAYHAGIWRAAQKLVAPGSTLFNKLCDTLREHEDFGLVFVGHSLGGAIASAATILLSEYHLDPTKTTDPLRGTWRTTSNDGFPGRRPIRAIAFAHPSTLSYALGKRTSYGQVPLVTTLILGSDIIPRFGHGQLRELRRVLGALTRVRRRRRMVSTTISSNPVHTSEKEEPVVHIVRRFWDWLSICRTRDPDAVMLDRRRRLEELFWRLRHEVEDDLYVQARRRFDEAAAVSDAAAREPISPWIAPALNKIPLHALSSRRQRLDSATLSSEQAHGGVLVPAGRCLWLSDNDIYEITNPLAFFSLPDLRTTMFADHFPAAYEEAILALGRAPTV